MADSPASSDGENNFGPLASVRTRVQALRAFAANEGSDSSNLDEDEESSDYTQDPNAMFTYNAKRRVKKNDDADEVNKGENKEEKKEEKKEDRNPKSWYCPQCTFKNSHLLPECEMCKTKRPSHDIPKGQGPDRELLTQSRVAPRKSLLDIHLRSIRKDMTDLVCLRGCDQYIVEKQCDYFAATGTKTRLKNAFALVPITTIPNEYHIIHLESGQYLSVIAEHMHEGSGWRLYGVPSKQMSLIDPMLLHFKIVDVPNTEDPDSTQHRVIISWRDRILTVPPSGHGVLLCYNDTDRPKKRLKKDAHIFTLEKPKAHQSERALEIIPLLDLVQNPRAEKCEMLSFPKVNNVPMKLFKTIMSIFDRINKELENIDDSTKHYAPFKLIWNEFAVFSKGMVSQTVISIFEVYVNNKLAAEEGSEDLLVHISDFVIALDAVTNFYEREIKMEKITNARKEKIERKLPLDERMKNLHKSILKDHPELKRWRKRSWFMRMLYDWKLWIKYQLELTSDVHHVRWGIMAGSLSRIQSGFGQSMYATFKINRWLILLNLVNILVFAPLFSCHALTMKWDSFSGSEYAEMLLGNEYEHSLWFYGGYRTSYPDSWASSVNFGFMYIATCGAVLFLNVVLLFRILVTTHEIDEGHEGLDFSHTVFAGFDHSKGSEWAIKLERNSKTVELHEKLLERFEEQRSYSGALVERILGMLFCVGIGFTGCLTIAVLITREHDAIIPWIKEKSSGGLPGGKVLLRSSEYIVPLAVLVLKFITPAVVQRVVVFENRPIKKQAQHIFIRIFLLRVAFLLFTLFYTAKKGIEVQTQPLETCAENLVGMMLYRLVETSIVMDLMIYIIIPNIRFCGTPNGCCHRWCPDSGRRATFYQEHISMNALSHLYSGQFGDSMRTSNRKSRLINSDSENSEESFIPDALAGDSWKKEFDVPGVLVDCLYRQVIIWCGMFYCPMLSVIGALSAYISFHVKWIYLRQFCSRPRKAYGVARGTKVYYGMLLLGVCCSISCFQYLLTRTPICGPHKGVNIRDVTVEMLVNGTPGWILTVFGKVLDPMIIGFIVVLLAGYINYLRGKNRKYYAAFGFVNSLLHSDVTSKRHLFGFWRDRND